MTTQPQQLSPKAQAALDTVIRKFQTGNLSAVVRVALFPIPQEWPASAWSFGNQVLAFTQKESLNCRGFRQWQEADRQVKKGTSAGFIWAPKTRTATKKNDAGEEEKRSYVAGFTPIPIFGPEDIDGDPLPDPDLTPKQLPPLADVAARLGITIHYTPTAPDRLGNYRRGMDAIRLGTPDERIWFHELAHAIHKRVDGLQGDEAHRETVADFTATVLMELYGIRDSTGETWRYISDYSRDPLTAIMKSLATVQKVLEFLEV